MNRTGRALLILTVAVLASCSPPSSPTPASATSIPPKSGLMRISLGGSADVKDVPPLLAYDALREQGYTVELVPFAKTSLIPAALDKGDIEISDATTALAWAAAAQGADIRSIVAKGNMTYVLASTKDIKNCQDLNGKPISFSTRQAVGYIMFTQHVAQNCPGIEPDVILISNSYDRLAALQAGQVVAAYLDLEGWLQVQQTDPDKFHVLIDLAREFPQVCFQTYGVRREWAQQNPDMVHDFIKALLIAERSVMANPALLRDGIIKYLSFEPARAQELAEAYLAAKMWDANGGMTPDNVAYTLQFMHDGGILASDLKPDDVADLSYLNSVLAEIGRQ